MALFHMLSLMDEHQFHLLAGQLSLKQDVMSALAPEHKAGGQVRTQLDALALGHGQPQPFIVLRFQRPPLAGQFPDSPV